MNVADCMAFTGHKDIRSFSAYLKVDIDELLDNMLEEEQEVHTGKASKLEEGVPRKQVGSLQTSSASLLGKKKMRS